MKKPPRPRTNRGIELATRCNGVYSTVEDNVINQNGRTGGSLFNMASEIRIVLTFTLESIPGLQNETIDRVPKKDLAGQRRKGASIGRTRFR